MSSAKRPPPLSSDAAWWGHSALDEAINANRRERAMYFDQLEASEAANIRRWRHVIMIVEDRGRRLEEARDYLRSVYVRARDAGR